MKTQKTKSRKSLRSSTLVRALVGSLVAIQALSACGPGLSPTSVSLANRATETVGCQQNFEDEFWDGIHDFSLKKEKLASRNEMKSAFVGSFMKGRLANLSQTDRNLVAETVADLYETVTEETLATLKIDRQDHQKILETLTGLEVGDRMTPETNALQDKIRAKFAEVERITGQVQNLAACPPATVSPTEPAPEVSENGDLSPQGTTLFEKWKQTRHPAVYGGLKAIATAYQSCEAGVQAALSSATPDIKGITVVGDHDQGGKKRKITNLASLIKSHPYLANYKKPGSGCFDVLKKPMIYDFGGKPYTGTSENAIFDFFKDAGSGTTELGIDCSGYVYASLATAGLKIKKTGKLKAVTVHGVPARSYQNIESSGLNCFAHAKFKSATNLVPGDILASSGHIILIESVGADPFGIKALKTEADCKAANISVSRFDFKILQSSPTKGAIGIDRIRANEYLKEKGSMQTAMIQHAVNACLAKVRGTTITTKSSSASLVRHLGTAECRDTPIKIAKEECVSTCQADASLLP